MKSFRLHWPKKEDYEKSPDKKVVRKTGKLDTSMQNNVGSLSAIVGWIVLSYLIGVVWGTVIILASLIIRHLVRKS